MVHGIREIQKKGGARLSQDLIATAEIGQGPHAYPKGVRHRFGVAAVGNGQSGHPIGDKVGEDQLCRYAALMEDFRKENQAKAPEQTPALLSPQSAVA